ncbi:MAG TPA: succinate dehydrogenase, hydrophobic membrane anchor protein [Steroidobacteraceae bacterium]|jgi:succinate dehydrogenase / fumarate reductase membrane anchor subunit|nr:succinate dehydrogenase, hydrophobic membrane anchor protein [Steroidobacteraceae bacterium]
MSLRTPLGKVLGKGSAGDGVAHWWTQRVTAIALIPLTAWFVIALLGMPLHSYEAMRGWLGQPWAAVGTLLLAIALAWHSWLGVQVVIEDYVHAKGAKTTMLLLSTFLHFAAVVAAVFAVVVMAVAS